MLRPRPGVVITVCWLGGAMAGSVSDGAGPADAATLLSEIQQQIGDSACDTDAQCHTLALGTKACGGPESYLAWSDKVSRAAPLAELAARYRAAREAENARNRVVSNCAVMTDPGAMCRPRAADGARVCQRGAGVMAGEP